MKKKLIEVAMPLEVIDRACQADKDRKTGSIRNLHKWFAPMPVPAWRALLFASLVDDPGDPDGRARLRRVIEDLMASGPDAPPAAVLMRARNEIKRSNPDGLPTIVDPFCGGGSTLIEAQRLGLQAIGSDLNPVAVLVTKTLCELLQRALDEPSRSEILSGATLSSVDELKAEIHAWAVRVGERVRTDVGDLYSMHDGGMKPYAWLWTRTARCPNPACRLTTPLASSWRLAARQGEERWVLPHVEGDNVTFTVTDDPTLLPEEVKIGRAEFRCLRCHATLNASYLREEARSDRMGIRLMAIAAIHGSQRVYLAPSEAEERTLELQVDEDAFLRLPIATGALGIQVPIWGLLEQRDLYLPRQALVLTRFADAVAALDAEFRDLGYSNAIRELTLATLGLGVSRLAMHNSVQVKWFTRNGPSKADPALREPNLPLVWTFAETNPFGGSVGDWLQVVDTALRAFDYVPTPAPPARTFVADARRAAELAPQAASLVATDPPYFGHIGYADLSDYFYVWLRRSLGAVFPDVFPTLAAPREGELIANPARHGGSDDDARGYFIAGFTDVFRGMRRVQATNVPMLVVYAHREFEGAQGWEAMLTSVLESGLQIVGTWPVEASRANRLRNVRSNALASYVVLVCRPRAESAEKVPFRSFDSELRDALRVALHELQEASTAPVDLAQATVGRGMSVFSKYNAVIAADGSQLTVAAALKHISDVRGDMLDEQKTAFDADTQFAIEWYEQYAHEPGPFGKADALARTKNIAVDGLVAAGIAESGAGKVRLLRRDELRDGWDPAADSRLTTWESALYLVRTLEMDGELAAGQLLARLPDRGIGARDLAYRIFATAEGRSQAEEARAFNALVMAWPELDRLGGTAVAAQQTMQV